VSRSNRSIFPRKVLVTTGSQEVSSLSLLLSMRMLGAQTKSTRTMVQELSAVSQKVRWPAAAKFERRSRILTLACRTCARLSVGQRLSHHTINATTPIFEALSPSPTQNSGTRPPALLQEFRDGNF
jgi:hypothetical protein